MSKKQWKRKIILLSSSLIKMDKDMFRTVKLELICLIREFPNVKKLLLIPYAQTDYDSYTAAMKKVIEPWGFEVEGIHTYPNAAEKLKSSNAIFVGEGNAFLLLKALYDHNLVDLINIQVDKRELLYIGCGAGVTVAGKSIHTTNDMPIVYPPTFLAIGFLNFDINPHYVATKSDSSMIPTRDERIHEYLKVNNKHNWVVLGLREGCIFDIDKADMTIRGFNGAVMFYGSRGNTPEFCNVGADMFCLIENFWNLEFNGDC